MSRSSLTAALILAGLALAPVAANAEGTGGSGAYERGLLRDSIYAFNRENSGFGSAQIPSAGARYDYERGGYIQYRSNQGSPAQSRYQGSGANIYPTR